MLLKDNYWFLIVFLLQDEEGFKSMVNEMTASQKAAALQAYQHSLRIQQEVGFFNHKGLQI